MLFKKKQIKTVIDPQTVSSPTPVIEAVKPMFYKTKQGIITFSSLVLISIGCGVYFISSASTEQPKTVEKAKPSIVKNDVVYSTTLDNSIKNKETEIKNAYPFGKLPLRNTVFYAYNIISNLDIITIDPLGEPLPSDSTSLHQLPTMPLGNANLAINLDSLPKQNYLIRLIVKNGDELLSTQHYYLSNNPYDRTIRLTNLKTGAYYIQALNLVTHSSYVSSPFYLNNAGEIVSGQNIGFERIDSENLFGLPENNEIEPLSLDEMPIILNDRHNVTEISPQEPSPFSP